MINSLVGREVFSVAKTSDGSINEVVQRTSAGSIDPVTRTSIIVSFDDTPGLEDTKYANKEWNADLMCAYSEEHYPKVSTGIPNLEWSPCMKTSTDISEPEWRPREKTYLNLIVLNVPSDQHGFIQ